jgi:hypothetical protein
VNQDRIDLAFRVLDCDMAPQDLLNKAANTIWAELDGSSEKYADIDRTIATRIDLKPVAGVPAKPDEHVLRRPAALDLVKNVVNCYLGLAPGAPIEHARVTSPDQLHCTVDLGLLLHALGGEYSEFASKIEHESAERKANTKSFLAGAGKELGKE